MGRYERILLLKTITQIIKAIPVPCHGSGGLQGAVSMSEPSDQKKLGNAAMCMALSLASLIITLHSSALRSYSRTCVPLRSYNKSEPCTMGGHVFVACAKFLEENPQFPPITPISAKLIVAAFPNLSLGLRLSGDPCRYIAIVRENKTI